MTSSVAPSAFDTRHSTPFLQHFPLHNLIPREGYLPAANLSRSPRLRSLPTHPAGIITPRRGLDAIMDRQRVGGMAL
jgi:hypothetical protein